MMTNQAKAAVAKDDGSEKAQTEPGTSKVGEEESNTTTTKTRRVDTRTRRFPVLTEEQLAGIQDPVERGVEGAHGPGGQALLRVARGACRPGVQLRRSL